ncbi:MAG: Ni/Fe-hydrogenase, b-type cytochrome subunit [bacterium]|nr:Ni/Fe-hydrogenase, b-type cytochrome subunit [bacterium]
MFKREYVWQAPVRFFHWINALAILALVLTGCYIANPITLNWGEASRSYVMGTVRFIHFTVAYVFLFNLLFRFYWAFVGNEHARWSALLPLSRRQLRDIVNQMLYYLLIRRESPHYAGHNPLAALSHVGLFVILIVQVFTGFALYSEAKPGGFYGAPFGWVLGLLGNQGARLLHHFIMWLVGVFFLIHMYLLVYAELQKKNGLISSIFSGFKFVPKQEGE